MSGPRPPSLIEPLRADAHYLEPALRTELEQAFGAPFGDVVVHSGLASAAAAERADAAAFTVGRHIVFGAGAFQPRTRRGRMLLAHELAHVQQQRRGGGDLEQGQSLPEAAIRRASEGEDAAQAAAARVADGGPAAVSGSAPVGMARAGKKEEKRIWAKVLRELVAIKKAQDAQRFEYRDETGATVMVTLDEWQRLKAVAARRIDIALTSTESTAENWRQTHREILDEGHAESFGDLIDKPSRIFGIASNIWGDVVPPTLGIWHHPVQTVRRARAALDAGDVPEAARLLQLATRHLKNAKDEWNAFIEGSIGGAGKLVGNLEFVRDTSFAIAIGAGAIVAAPVVAAGVGAMGATGATATALTAAGTGALTMTGGATLRGTADAVGQKVVNGKWDAEKTWKHVRAHLAEDMATGTTAGVARMLGSLAGAGKHGVTRAGAVVRNIGAQSATAAGTGVASTAVDSGIALAEGKSWEQVWDEHIVPGVESTAMSTVTAALSAPLGVFGQRMGQSRPALGKVIDQSGGALVAGGSTLAAGGSWEEARSNAIASAVSSGITGAARGRPAPIRGSETKSQTEGPRSPGQLVASPLSAPNTRVAERTADRPSDAKRRARAGERMRQHEEARHQASEQAQQKTANRVLAAEKRLAEAKSAIDARSSAGKPPTKAQEKELAVATNNVSRAARAHARATNKTDITKQQVSQATERARDRNAAYQKAKSASSTGRARPSAKSGNKQLKRIWRREQKAAWKSWASEEIAARRSGTSEAPMDAATYDAQLAAMAATSLVPVDESGRVDWGQTSSGIKLPGAAQELNPIKALTNDELADVARTGKMPARVAAEIEHARIPQRVGRWLTAAGLPPKEAASLSKLGALDNLEPASRKWHGIVDEMAARRTKGHDRTDPMSSLDIRAGRPLGSATEQELGQIVEALKKPGMNLDRKFDVDGKQMSWRDILRAEKRQRQSSWDVP